jgi:hypothetical protein
VIPWSPEEIAELKLLAKNGVRSGDMKNFAIRHQRKYRTAYGKLQKLRASGARLTYAERLALLRAEE